MKERFVFLLMVTTLVLPWKLRRLILNTMPGIWLHPRSYMGFSIVVAVSMRLEDGARIGHFNFIRGLENLLVGYCSTIGSFNWISGYPLSRKGSFLVSRDPSLYLGREAAITSRHLIDCTDSVRIGEFSILAGYRSQILTHGIDVRTSIQRCSPVSVGRYCFIGTSTVLLQGANINDRVVVAASSVVTSGLSAGSNKLYGGVPAKYIRDLHDCSFFCREKGYVE